MLTDPDWWVSPCNAHRMLRFPPYSGMRWNP